MKKIFLLLCFTLMYCTTYAQEEFKKFYLNTAIRYRDEQNFKNYDYRSVIVFNYNNTNEIRFITKDQVVKAYTSGDYEVGYTDKNERFQRINISDGVDSGVLILYDSPKLGCLLILKKFSIGYYNEVKY